MRETIFYVGKTFKTAADTLDSDAHVAENGRFIHRVLP